METSGILVWVQLGCVHHQWTLVQNHSNVASFYLHFALLPIYSFNSTIDERIKTADSIVIINYNHYFFIQEWLVYTNLFLFECEVSNSANLNHTLLSSSNKPVVSSEVNLQNVKFLRKLIFTLIISSSCCSCNANLGTNDLRRC